MESRKLDYGNIAYFKMVGDSMNNGLRNAIGNGDTLVCAPIKVGELVIGDMVAVESSESVVVGVVDNVGKSFVTLSRLNPRFGNKRILVRRTTFYLVLETRRKMAAAYDGILICLKGLA